MANDLTTFVDRAQMISSPVLKRLRRISIGTVQWPGQPIRTYLAGGLRLTDQERREAMRELERLRQVTTSDDSTLTRRERLGLIAKMLLAYPVANASKESGQARAEAYLDALDDVPPWALAAAVRRWNRGAAGEEHDYRWPPAPAVLRKIAVAELEELRPIVLHLEQLLAAMSPEEAIARPTTEERAKVLDGFTKLQADLRAPTPHREAAE